MGGGGPTRRRARKTTLGCLILRAQPVVISKGKPGQPGAQIRRAETVVRRSCNTVPRNHEAMRRDCKGRFIATIWAHALQAPRKVQRSVKYWARARPSLINTAATITEGGDDESLDKADPTASAGWRENWRWQFSQGDIPDVAEGVRARKGLAPTKFGDIYGFFFSRHFVCSIRNNRKAF